MLHSSYPVLVWSGFKILWVTRIRGGRTHGQKERTDLGTGTGTGWEVGEGLERGKGMQSKVRRASQGADWEWNQERTFRQAWMRIGFWRSRVVINVNRKFDKERIKIEKRWRLFCWWRMSSIALERARVSEKLCHFNLER